MGTIRNAIQPVRRLLGEPQDAEDDKDAESAGSPAPPPEVGAAKGGVMIMRDGGVSIFDGTKSVSLSAAEVVPVGVQLVFTFLDNRVTLFVNGALQHTGDCATDYDGHPFILGRGFKGAILNLDVWHRTLGVQEISKLPKPTNEASANEFLAHSHEGKYELAKRKSEDFARREILQRQRLRLLKEKQLPESFQTNSMKRRCKPSRKNSVKRKKPERKRGMRARRNEIPRRFPTRQRRISQRNRRRPANSLRRIRVNKLLKSNNSSRQRVLQIP